jgi:heme A synthase
MKSDNEAYTYATRARIMLLPLERGIVRRNYASLLENQIPREKNRPIDRQKRRNPFERRTWIQLVDEVWVGVIMMIGRKKMRVGSIPDHRIAP